MSNDAITVTDEVAKAMSEAESEMAEAQRRVSAAWAELTHAQNAIQRAQQKWLDAKLHAKKVSEGK